MHRESECTNENVEERPFGGYPNEYICFISGLYR